MVKFVIIKNTNICKIGPRFLLTDRWLFSRSLCTNGISGVSVLNPVIKSDVILLRCHLHHPFCCTEMEEDVAQRSTKAAAVTVVTRHVESSRHAAGLVLMPFLNLFPSKAIFMKPLTSAFCTENSSQLQFRVLTCKSQQKEEEEGKSFFTIYIVSEHMATWSFFWETDGISDEICFPLRWHMYVFCAGCSLKWRSYWPTHICLPRL